MGRGMWMDVRQLRAASGQLKDLSPAGRHSDAPHRPHQAACLSLCCSEPGHSGILQHPKRGTTQLAHVWTSSPRAVGANVNNSFH